LSGAHERLSNRFPLKGKALQICICNYEKPIESNLPKSNTKEKPDPEKPLRSNPKENQTKPGPKGKPANI